MKIYRVQIDGFAEISVQANGPWFAIMQAKRYWWLLGKNDIRERKVISLTEVEE